MSALIHISYILVKSKIEFKYKVKKKLNINKNS